MKGENKCRVVEVQTLLFEDGGVVVDDRRKRGDEIHGSKGGKVKGESSFERGSNTLLARHTGKSP